MLQSEIPFREVTVLTWNIFVNMKMDVATIMGIMVYALLYSLVSYTQWIVFSVNVDYFICAFIPF